MGNKNEILARAVEEWRAGRSADERLGDVARAHVLREALHPAENRTLQPFAALFMPFRRLALASALPALLLAFVVGYLPFRESAEQPQALAPMLQASKVNGQVVFEIANGDRVHRVYRWQGSWTLYGTTKGSFADELRTEGDLVIYRIE